MSVQSPEQRQQSFTPQQWYEIGYFLCQTWGTPLEVLLHRNIGSRYLGGPALAVFPLTFVYMLFWEGPYDLRPLLWFLGLYLAALFLHGIGRWRWLWGPEFNHSRYTGHPRLLRFFPWCSEINFKRRGEPLIAAAIGGLLVFFNPPLGVYLMLSAVGLAAACDEIVARERRRVRDLNDTMIDQHSVAERFRNRHSDPFQ